MVKFAGAIGYVALSILNIMLAESLYVIFKNVTVLFILLKDASKTWALKIAESLSRSYSKFTYIDSEVWRA